MDVTRSVSRQRPHSTDSHSGPCALPTHGRPGVEGRKAAHLPSAPHPNRAYRERRSLQRVSGLGEIPRTLASITVGYQQLDAGPPLPASPGHALLPALGPPVYLAFEEASRNLVWRVWSTLLPNVPALRRDTVVSTIPMREWLALLSSLCSPSPSSRPVSGVSTPTGCHCSCLPQPEVHSIGHLSCGTQ